MKLTDTQLVLLSAASQREERVYRVTNKPVPPQRKGKPGRKAR